MEHTTKIFALRRGLAVTIAALVVNFAIVSTVPAQATQDAQRIEKVKKSVNKIGVDERVNVKLIDGSTRKGRISIIDSEHFVLVDKKTGDSTTLRFAQVQKVRRVEDGPFSDPVAIMGIAFIPLILGFAFWARNKD